MQLPLAMIDPAAGAGGAVVMLALIVSLIAGIVHFFSRHFFVICFVAALAQFIFILIPWVLFDVMDPDSGDRVFFSMRLLLLSFLLPLAGSAIAGMPAMLIRGVISLFPEGE